MAIRRVNQAALGNTGIHKDNSAFIGPGDLVGAEADLRPHAPGRPGDEENVVHPVDLVDVGSFRSQNHVGAGHGAGVGNDHLVNPAPFHCTGVFRQLQKADVAAAVDEVDPPVIIKEQGHVMGELQHGAFPRPVLNVFRFEDECPAFGLRTEGHIENTVVVSQAAGPRTSAVFVLAVAQSLGIAGAQNIINIIDNFPVHQVGRFHDGNTWVHVHGGTGHVIGVPHPDHAGIGDIGPDNRVLRRDNTAVSRLGWASQHQTENQHQHNLAHSISPCLLSFSPVPLPTGHSTPLASRRALVHKPPPAD